MIERLNLRCDLKADRGIDPETARLAVEAGANVFVTGMSVLEMNSLRASIRLVRATNGQ